MKLGAYDYLIKPSYLTDLMSRLKRASQMLWLRVRVRDTTETAKGQFDFGRVVTHNPAMCQMLEVARKAAEADHSTILIQARVEQERAFWRAPSTTPAGKPVRRCWN